MQGETLPPWPPTPFTLISGTPPKREMPEVVRVRNLEIHAANNDVFAFGAESSYTESFHALAENEAEDDLDDDDEGEDGSAETDRWQRATVGRGGNGSDQEKRRRGGRRGGRRHGRRKPKGKGS